MSLQVKIKTLTPGAEIQLPAYGSLQAAGADICAYLPEQKKMIISPLKRVLIPTGLCAEIPPGYEIQVRPRSGLSLKTGLMVVNSPGTIDADYRGEIKIIMGNLGDREEVIHHGDRIAQLVLAKVYQGEFILTQEDLTTTQRGAGGFGSTGVETPLSQNS